MSLTAKLLLSYVSQAETSKQEWVRKIRLEQAFKYAAQLIGNTF